MENELVNNLEDLQLKIWGLAMEAKEKSKRAAKRYNELREYEKENKLTSRQEQLKELNREERYSEQYYYTKLINIWMDVIYINEEKKHGLEF